MKTPKYSSVLPSGLLLALLGSLMLNVYQLMIDNRQPPLPVGRSDAVSQEALSRCRQENNRKDSLLFALRHSGSGNMAQHTK